MTLKDVLKRHIIDTTAIVSVMNPAFAFVETRIVGMSDLESIKAKFFGTALAYLVTGAAYSRGQDLLRKKLRVAKDGLAEKLHDTVYSIAFHAAFIPTLYYASGCRDYEQIKFGTAVACGTALATGSLVGIAKNNFREVCKNSLITSQIKKIMSTFS